MRICIMASGRCGSSSLYNCIKEHLSDDYTFLEEPLDRHYKIEENLSFCDDDKNVLLKMLLGQAPSNVKENSKLFYESIFKTFDKVIILDRINKIEQSESFIYHTVNKIKDRHKRKRVYYLNSIPKDTFNEWELNLIVVSDALESFSENYNKKIYYYEDIFVNKNTSVINEIFDYLELKPIEESINNWLISDDKKVRISEKYGKFL